MKDKKHTHICITRKGQERFLLQDVTALGGPAECSEIAPGTIGLSGVSAAELAALPPFFSRQMLPYAELAQSTSIRSWATLLFEKILEHQQEFESKPWCLLIYSPESAERGEVFGRSRLIYEETLQLLKQKRRSLLKTLAPPHSEAQDLSYASIAQLLLLDSSHGYVSICPGDERQALKAALRPSVAGYESIPDDKSPPSRAFKKLVEALRVFDLTPAKGEHCVDLGASPGGWTHVLAALGCTITAIDRSPLDARLMANRRITFVKGDALTWLPPKPVGMLVCDVITSPDKTIGMLRTWLTRRLCSSFCVTIKFKGSPDFEALREIRCLLKEQTSWFDGKQLCHNKNELTVVGRQ